MKKPRVGDVLAFSLPSGQICYAHYIQLHPEFGTLVRIFRTDDQEPRSPQNVYQAQSPFNPVFVGLYAAVRSGRWKSIGTLAPPPEPFPRFRWTFGTKPGKYTDWRIWDGQRDVLVGELPPADRALELRLVWGAEGLEERLAGARHRGDEML